MQVWSFVSIPASLCAMAAPSGGVSGTCRSLKRAAASATCELASPLLQIHAALQSTPLSIAQHEVRSANPLNLSI